MAVEGMGLQAPAGTVLPEGPTVEVLDQVGDPVEGVSVTFQVLEGGGTAPVPSRQTDSRGQARIPWILGRDVGSPQRLRATAGDLSVEFQAGSIEAVPGQSYLGRNGYTEFFPGDMPLVLSAPHGGNLSPEEIPDRSYGTTGQDRNTMELALRIRETIRAQTGFYPHLIVSHLHRVKLDPNREIVEAAQGDPESERAWWEFQTSIDEATKIVEASFGEGLYIDLHGHGHEIQRLELGYLLSSSDLENSNPILSGASFINKSSFRALGEKPGVDFADLIRGPESLGSLLEAEGVPAVPSQNQPDPGGNDFFSGGYNTAQHGSRYGGSVSGVQIECNYTGVRDTAENRQALAEALGRALATFFPAHFEMELGPLPSPARK
jgi:N-formylglutamate amidohydrolase